MDLLRRHWKRAVAGGVAAGIVVWLLTTWLHKGACVGWWLS